MQKSLILFSAIVAAVLGSGPTAPIDGFSASDCPQAGYFAVDQNNMCWYHECVNHANEEGESYLHMLPRRCALGSKVSYNFVTGETNPCTINFDAVIGYDCKRGKPSVAGPPECYSDGSIECLNGGTLTYESNLCWCLCPPSWDGNWNCDRPVIPKELREYLAADSNICVDGEPLEDWCAAGPCLNGGTCYNQCDTHWCDCPYHEDNDYYGKNCEPSPYH